ncbi:MAG: phosphomannomutase/phosphoglucomutase [Sulfitobacter sp.]|jgi:phosphomannomutase/phosphoglucomutase
MNRIAGHQASDPPENSRGLRVSLKSNSHLVAFSLIPLGGILIGFVVAIIISLLFLQSSVTDAHRKSLINQAADNTRARVNQAQTKLLKQANNMATSIRLTELVVNADASARSLEEARLRELIPNAVRVRMIRIGEARVDRDEDPPFTYTSLDLVNKAEQGETVYPEAINANGRWVIGLAAPIKPPSSDAIRGTLMVYLDTAALLDEISEEIQGSVTIIQAFNSNQQTEFLQAGEGTGDILERDLINKVWKLQFQPSEALSNASIGNVVTFSIPLVGFLLIAFGAVFIGIKKIIATLQSDTTLLQNQMADAINGTFSPSENFELSEFVELDLTLARLGKKEGEKKEVKPLNVTAKPKAVVQPDAIDVEVDEDGGYLEGSEEEEHEFKNETKEEAIDVSGIFRAYDIRGVVGQTLTNEVAYRIGQAIGSEADSLGETKLVVGADGRLSSPDIVGALIDGLISTGREVINIGFVPTPLLYYATHNSEATSGVMVTGSHNPADHNGMKIVLAGQALMGDGIQKLFTRYQDQDFVAGDGDVTEIDIREDYMDAITDDVVVAQPLKVVVDCGNGIAGDILPTLLGNLGCDVVEMYCDVDGNFPNHHPDPTVPANLEDLIITVRSEEADLGIALDGDGDRLVAVTAEGEIVWPDRLLMLFAKDVVSRNPGSDVVYDVKCTRHLNSVISGFGGRPVMCRSGHSYIKAKMKETDAILGGEMSGHICFKERWFGFDDGLYSTARLLEIVGSQSEGLSELLEQFPASISTPEIKIPVTESHKFDIVAKLIESADFGDATMTNIDGLRVDFAEGWGLVRASNTTACLTLRFEADDNASLEDIQNLFREKLKEVQASLTF